LVVSRLDGYDGYDRLERLDGYDRWEPKSFLFYTQPGKAGIE
jgi:hypothetical protein